MTGSYGTRADLARLATNPRWLSSVRPEKQDAALKSASDFADGYLSGQYTLPLKSWGDDLVWAVCQVAFYRLVTSEGYNPDTEHDADKRYNYEQAVAWLTGVRDKDIIPPGIVDSSAADDESFVVSSTQRGYSTRETSEKAKAFQGD